MKKIKSYKLENSSDEMSDNNHLITCPKCGTVCEPGDSECEDCGYPFNRPKILLACPVCEAPREKNRRGVYKWFCSCGYEYEDSVYRKGQGSANRKETGATGELPKDGVKLQEETDSDYDTIASVPPGSLMSCPQSGTISVEGSKGGDGGSSRTNQAAGEGHGKEKTGTVLRTVSLTKDGRPPSESLSLSELSCDPQSSTSVPLDTSLASPQSSAPIQQSVPSLGLATSASPVPVPVNKIPLPTSKVTPSSPSSINPSLTHVSPSQSPIRGFLPSAPLSNGRFSSSAMHHPQPSRRIQSIASPIRPRSVPLPLRAQYPEHFERSKSENSVQNICFSDSPLKLQPLDLTNRSQSLSTINLEKIIPVSPREDIITAGPHVPTLGHVQADSAATKAAALTEASGGADAATEFNVSCRGSRDCSLIIYSSNIKVEQEPQNIDIRSSVGQVNNILQQKMFDVYRRQTEEEVSSSESFSTSSLNPNNEQRDHQSSPEVSETLSAVSSSTLDAGAAVGIGQNGDHNYDNMSLELGDFTAAEVNSSAFQPNAQSSPNAANAQSSPNAAADHSIPNAANNHDSSDATENSDCCGNQPKSLKQSRSVEERMHELEQTVIDLAREKAKLKRELKQTIKEQAKEIARLKRAGGARDESLSDLNSRVNSYQDEREQNSNSIDRLQKESLETKVQVNKNKEDICEMEKRGNEARDQRRALSLKANQTTDDVKDLQVARREMEVDMSGNLLINAKT